MKTRNDGIRALAYAVAALAALGGLFTAGCQRGAAPAENPVATIALTAVDSRGLAEAIARQRGKVVLVDFWATWCVPCVKLFPHTVEMQRRLADRGLAVIAVSMDDAQKQEAVLHFLRNHQASFENHISRYGLGPEGFEAFDIADGALPHVKLYDRSGKLQKTFASGGEPLAPGPIEEAVLALLKP